MTIAGFLTDTNLDVKSITAVRGGDINQAFCITDAGERRYFLKINNAQKFPRMFEKEAAGLKSLKARSSLTVPEVLKYAIVDGWQYLMLEWISAGPRQPGFWEHFGKALAHMHQQPGPYFGWDDDNYIGSLPQQNQQWSNWADFYTNCRIMPIVQQLKERGGMSAGDRQNALGFCARIAEIFPTESPSLLHGDLWSGNFMTAPNGHAAIYDPAVYYGHREMDIGMTRLFGGFDRRFYEGYHEAYPLEKGWEDRLPYTQLYPLLVHALLFGGHYVGNVRQILKGF